MNVIIKPGSLDMSMDEIKQYKDYVKSKYPAVKSIELFAIGDEVEISYDIPQIPFDRIRRITGYLVGNMDRWNDAKRAEEHDRVKHGLGGIV